MSVDAPLYPVNLVVAGRPVLVVGAGRVAATKVRSLVAAGAEVTVVAPEVDPAVEAVDGVVIERRPYERGDVEGRWLVVCAVGDRAVAEQVAADAGAAGVWVNVADVADLCTVVLPAVARRGPITVAIGTGGRSPALATWMRRRMEDELGPEYEVLLDLLEEVRSAVKASGRSTEGLDWQSALDGGMLEMVRAGRTDEARATLEGCL